MNRTIRNLVIAVPLATVGLTMVNVAAATAGPNGPDVIAIPKQPKPPKGPGDIAIPKPKPQPPKGPKDLKDAPKDKGPKDKAPKPQSQPTGPQVVGAPEAAEPEAKAVVVAEVISAHGSADSIDRSDVLFVAGPAETELLVEEDATNGFDLTWLLVGGGVVTASGIAFAARKRQQTA